jgi:sugar/nucleoside kinase (ribokinase family)
MPTVLVIGDVMTDVVVRPEGPIAVGSDRRSTIRMLEGGSGANQACWLAREGVETRFVARVGNDRDAQTALLSRYGVDAQLGADDELPTGTLVTLLSPDGERSFLTDRAANLFLSASDLPASLLEGVSLLHVSGYALFEEGPRSAVLALFKAAKGLGIPVSVDPASYSFLQEVGREQFFEWTAGAHFLFPNKDEAAVLSGETSVDAQLSFLSRLYPVVALKRGKEGAIAAGDGRRWSAPAPTVSVLDTSGAGDAFLGGFLAAWLRDEGIEAALKRGVDLGSHAVTRLGARPLLPSG